VTGRACSPREIPTDWQEFNHFTDEIKLVALFDPSVKHQLIDAYGLGCYEEEADGLRFEFCYTNKYPLISWLLGFGGMVKILEPEWIASEVYDAAAAIVDMYKHDT